jgi:hypothetical protein
VKKAEVKWAKKQVSGGDMAKEELSLMLVVRERERNSPARNEESTEAERSMSRQ